MNQLNLANQSKASNNKYLKSCNKHLIKDKLSVSPVENLFLQINPKSNDKRFVFDDANKSDCDPNHDPLIMFERFGCFWHLVSNLAINQIS
ncbi:hypothetical protein BLOT_007442 [Blomia tropicalis]|nr:hypothetical protein BLOT_007442 [Blomia tropicalis]